VEQKWPLHLPPMHALNNNHYRGTDLCQWVEAADLPTPQK